MFKFILNIKRLNKCIYLTKNVTICYIGVIFVKFAVVECLYEYL